MASAWPAHGSEFDCELARSLCSLSISSQTFLNSVLLILPKTILRDDRCSDAIMNNQPPQESPPSSSAASSSTATPRESPKVPPGLGLEAHLAPNTAPPTLGEWTFQGSPSFSLSPLPYLSWYLLCSSILFLEMENRRRE